jgi:hypothetical protein
LSKKLDVPYYDLNGSHDIGVWKYVRRIIDGYRVIERQMERILKWFDSEHVKIDYTDTWNMDRTLAIVIEPALKAMRNKQGTPDVEPSDLPDHISILEMEKRWNWVLDEMIFAFKEIINPTDFTHNADNLKFEFVSSPTTGYKTMEFGVKDPSKPAYYRDKEAEKANERRIERGLYYFGKYFRSLGLNGGLFW